MHTKNIVFIGLLLLPAMASSNVQLQTQESVCRILARNKSNQQLSYICSGVITKSNEITTAEHCGDDLNSVDIVVECAQSSVDLKNSTMESTQSGNLVMISGPQFKESANVTKILIPELNRQNYRKDIAKFILDRDLKTSPIAGATKSELSKIFNVDLGSGQKMLSQDANCVSLGYGVSAKGHAGILKTVNYPNTFLVMIEATGYNPQIIGQHEFQSEGGDFEEQVLKLLEPAVINSTFTKNLNGLYDQANLEIEFVQPGDSGGVILCRESSLADYKLVGISSKFSFGSEQEYGFFQSTFETYPDFGDYIEISPADIPNILQYHF